MNRYNWQKSKELIGPIIQIGDVITINLDWPKARQSVTQIDTCTSQLVVVDEPREHGGNTAAQFIFHIHHSIQKFQYPNIITLQITNATETTVVRSQSNNNNYSLTVSQTIPHNVIPSTAASPREIVQP